ncbi:MAG: FG-GAP-like repeat-containing protein, partial [Phycisphaerae bacterium]
TFYAGDFNGDGRCDLAASMPNGIYLYRSTGTSFAKPILWFSGVGPPTGGFIVGDFDCDGVCDFARRNSSTGFVEMLIGFSFAASFGTPAAPPFLVSWSRLSYASVTTRPLLAGDFDGNGRDDLFEPSAPNIAKVHRACEPCPCLELKAGTPLCDPNDATKYTLPLTIRNRTPYPVSDITLQGLTGFGVSPANVSVLSPCGAPLLPNKTRSFAVMITGVSANVLQEIRASVLLFVPGGDIYICDDRACFIPPPCSCMQSYPANDGPWYECEPTASGAACLNLAVRNISGVPVCGVRVTSLTPGVTISPDVLCIPPLPTGSSYAFDSCDFEFAGSSSSGFVTLHVEMLDCNTVGCDDCACNAVCDEEISFDYSPCPREIGECCITPGGLQHLTFLDCQAAGGAWAPPGTSIYCPQTWGASAASAIQVEPVGADAFITLNAEQRLFISQLPTDGSGGADITVNAAERIAIPLEEISSDDEEVLPAVRLLVDGVFGGAPNVRLGELDLSLNSEDHFGATVDFGAVGATGVELIYVFDGDPVSTLIDGPIAGVTFSVWPINIEAVVANGRPGFRFEFPSTTQLQSPAIGTTQALEFSLTGVREPVQAEFLTRLELRAAGMSRIGAGIFAHESTPCEGDLTGDCQIDLADLNIINSALGGGGGEADVNGDGMINIVDLQIVLASLNTTCACAEGPMPKIAGDTNCDGFVTVSDIGPFVLALTDPTAYNAQFPACDVHSADVNGDGFVTVSDIGPFVALLTGS